MREIISAARRAKIKGHGLARVVECPYCGTPTKISVSPHLKREHPDKWQQWRTDMLELYNEGLSTMQIARECYMLFSWSTIENVVTKLAEEAGITLQPPITKEIKSWGDNCELQKTTVWNFTKRGTWAVHDGRYRGNWPPQVPNNIIRRYSNEGELVLDPFLGGGTTIIESWLIGRRSIGLDISPHAISISTKRIEEMFEKAGIGNLNPSLRPIIRRGDARNLSFLENESVDLICTQPPYLNSLKYTHFEKNDLSHIGNEKEFCEEFKKVAQECFRVLKRGKICAVQIGDTRKLGRFCPLGSMILNELISTGFETKNIIIKLQYADKSTAFYKNLNDFQIAHEYIFIMGKPIL
jgi:SAM-dependent methyltransferase